jgi:hypothetical protein
MDVVSYRFKRQEQMNHNGWVLNNGRWLHGEGCHCSLKGFVPAFRSIVRRANPEICRRKRLESEDVMLRSVLLPPEERSNDLWDGEITILEDVVVGDGATALRADSNIIL